MEKRELKLGDVVQIAPSAKDPQFASCLMTVTEPKSFGAQGYVEVPGAGQAYYRANWEEMEYVGMAWWVRA